MSDEIKTASISAFETSVEQFSHINVNGDIDKEKREMLPSLIIRSVLIALCICMFGYATFMIGANIVESNAASDLYESIRTDAKVSAVKHSPSLLEPASMYTFLEMLNANGDYLNYIGGLNSMDDMARRSACYRNFLNQRARYPDTYAWIYVDYTRIDYPIMKGPYNDYYMNKNYKGEDATEGSVTAHSSMSDVYSENTNNVFYGHCMKNGLMFRTLKTFMESANRNTLAKNMNIEVYAPEGLYIYQVMSGYRNDGSSFTKHVFDTDEQYIQFLDLIAERNTLRVAPSYNAQSKICTLITCANVSSNEDERYVVHGILKTFIPASQL